VEPAGAAVVGGTVGQQPGAKKQIQQNFHLISDE